MEADVLRFDTQVKELNKFVDDLEKIVAEYDKEQRSLEEKQNCLRSFRDNEEKRLARELGAGVGQIKGKVDPFREEVETLRQRIIDEDRKLAQYEKELTDAKQAETDAKAEFERQKKSLESIKARLKKLDSLSEDVVKLCREGQLAFAYWLLTTEKLKCEDKAKDKLEPRFKDKLIEEPQVVSTAELRCKLMAAWARYANALKCTFDADARVKGSKDALKTIGDQLAAATKRFDASVKTALSNIKPKS